MTTAADAYFFIQIGEGFNFDVPQNLPTFAT